MAPMPLAQPSSLSASECDNHLISILLCLYPVSQSEESLDFTFHLSLLPGQMSKQVPLSMPRTNNSVLSSEINYPYFSKKKRNDQIFGNLRTAFPSHWGSPNNHLTGGWRILSSALPQPEGVSECNFKKA